MKWLIALIVLSVAGCASAKKQTPADTGHAPNAATVGAQPSVAATDGAKISCSKGDDVRLLEVANKGSGCVLDYTKSGKTTAAASSAHGKKHCVDTQVKIRTKLEGAGFKCAMR